MRGVSSQLHLSHVSRFPSSYVIAHDVVGSSLAIMLISHMRIPPRPRSTPIAFHPSQQQPTTTHLIHPEHHIQKFIPTMSENTHPTEDQKKAIYEGLSSDQKSKQTYTEWVKDAYNNQYENWMPWIEDKYLAWFGTDNKASYATKGMRSPPLPFPLAPDTPSSSSLLRTLDADSRDP